MAGNPVLVAGAGSWGTALGIVLARNGHIVYLWDKVNAHINRIKKDKSNQRYLPGHKLPDSIIAEPEFKTAFNNSRDIIIVVPSHGLREVLNLIPGDSPDRKLCIATKGLEQGSQKFAHQVAGECLNPETSIAILSGPSFAKEVAEALPTAVTIASYNIRVAEHFAALFHDEKFRIYTHDDVIGVEVGGAVKNIMAIAAGIADGLGFGANTRAALITRGLAEIIRLGDALGARRSTFMGLAGLGDLVLTCTDDLSRNRRLGLALANGKSLDQARKEIGQEIEGVSTAAEVFNLATSLKIEMPITEQVNKVLKAETSPLDAVKALLSREQKPEII